ncbi:MAG: folK [Chloroflexi bacterium]|nr:folK [Chloroflexota bacterium]
MRRRVSSSSHFLATSGDRYFLPSAPKVEVAYLGLGSNLGDRAGNLWGAVERLAALRGTRILSLSPLYESEPVGPVDQPWFLNAIVAVATELSPVDLLRDAKAIERQMGRLPSERWGPRLIDIDLIFVGEVVLETEELILPHPELWNRQFVLRPLGDVLPGGGLHDRVDERLDQIGERPVVRRFDGSV